MSEVHNRGYGTCARCGMYVINTINHAKWCTGKGATYTDLHKQLDSLRKDLRLIRQAGHKGQAYTCACIADRALKEEK